jgi:hypothetical protein
MRILKLRLLTLLSIVTYSGCTTLDNVNPDIRAQEYQQFDIDIKLSERLINEGDISNARIAVNKLLARTPPKNEKYYTGAYYFDSLISSSALAYLELIVGNPQAAQDLYLSAFDAYQIDERHHISLLKEKVSDFSTLGLILSQAGNIVNQANINTGRSSLVIGMDVVENISNESLVSGQNLAGSGVLGYGAVLYDGVRINPIPVMGPLFNIGRLDFGNGWCTASLIGERLALTNQHCVINENGSDKATGAILKFETPRHPDAVTVIGFETANQSYKINSVHDWAILKLDRHPYGRGYFGIFNADKQPAKGAEIILGGFSSDLNSGKFLTVDWGCTLREDMRGNQSVSTNCRGWSGASGSPAIMKDEKTQNALLVGVFWGRRTDSKGNSIRMFTPVTQFAEQVARARRQE